MLVLPAPNNQLAGQAGLGAAFSLCFTSGRLYVHQSLSLHSSCHLLSRHLFPPPLPPLPDPAGIVPLLLPMYCLVLPVSPAPWEVSVR